MVEHFLEADRIMVIMLGRIRGIKAVVGKVEPCINVDCNSAYTLRLQRTDEPPTPECKLRTPFPINEWGVMSMLQRLEKKTGT